MCPCHERRYGGRRRIQSDADHRQRVDLEPLVGYAVYIWHATRAKVAVSQLALPKATCDAVYATTGYSVSVTNLGKTSLASDMVFSDGSSLQVPTMSGSVGANLSAALTVAVG